MKKFFNMIFIVCFMLLGSGFAKLHNDEILEVIQKQIPNDNFYFIRGLEREWGFNTNVRYRGIVYSDKLKEAKAFMGIQIALESLDSLYMWEDDFKDQYENALASPRLVKIVRENAKDILGEDIIVYVDLSDIFLLKEAVEFVEQNIGNFIPDDEVGPPIYIDIFVDDIKKVNIDEYKKKLFELHQRLYFLYNINSRLYLDLQDKKYLTYDIVKKGIFYIFKKDPKIKKYLKKYKKEKTLPPKEMGYLMDNFAGYFYGGDIPKIFLQTGDYDKKYEDVNVIFFEEDKK